MELGGIGRGHESRLDLAEAQRWLEARRLPTLAAQKDRDELKVVETILYDSLKRDELARKVGITEVQAIHAILLIYECAHRNINETPLELKDLPEPLARLSANYLDSVKRGHF